jgi:hypothetical protein
MHYYIQLDPDGLVVSVTDSSKPIEAENVVETPMPRYDWLGYTYDREADTATPPVEPDPTPQPRIVTIGSFKRRIGVMTVFALSTSKNKVCVALRSYLSDLRHVDLDNPETGQMLGMLAMARQPAADPDFPGSGPITLEYIQAILSAPVEEGERP